MLRIIVVSFLLFTGLTACGLLRHTQRKQACAVLVEAYRQERMSGVRGGISETGTYIVARWNCPSLPETFFWRGEGGWFPCKVEKVHTVKVTPDMPGDGYLRENVAGMAVSRGDTLMLTPLSGGKFPVPEEVTDDMHNILFYKTSGSSWIKLPIKQIKKKTPISMP